MANATDRHTPTVVYVELISFEMKTAAVINCRLYKNKLSMTFGLNIFDNFALIKSLRVIFLSGSGL